VAYQEGISSMDRQYDSSICLEPKPVKIQLLENEIKSKTLTHRIRKLIYTWEILRNQFEFRWYLAVMTKIFVVFSATQDK
jgi:hypothetical protein